MNWNFDNSLVRELNGFYAQTQPEPPLKPELLLFNQQLAEELGLTPADAAAGDLVSVFSGGDVPDGAQPVALAYSGHQFGQFAPLLGDGRAILLGEIVTPSGVGVDIQLKGAGMTPFSRGGDGKLALGPALREYLVSEAMHALGIPTTRSLAVTLTGEVVERESDHPGAVLTRTASSHLRVGSFQFAATHLGSEEVKRLADYAIDRHYPEAHNTPNPYLWLLEQIRDAQIAMIARWMNVGFVHGVMNTDNFTISGETIDYGPCAFMDGYSRTAVFSSIDQFGRYAFGNQPNIGRWNFSQFATSIAPLIVSLDSDGIEKINALMKDFPQRYIDVWLRGMRAKLGFGTKHESDLLLANELFAIMEGQNVDFTTLFRRLAEVPEKGSEPVSTLFSDRSSIDHWLHSWADRISEDVLDDDERRASMNLANPVYIPRNHKVEEALEAAETGDFQPFKRLLSVVTKPFEERPELQGYAEPAPKEFGRYVTFCGT